MSNSNQIKAARQTYAAVLRALDAAARWQKQEATQTESEFTHSIQAAETARKRAEESAAGARAAGIKQANETRHRAEDAIKRGESLYQSANLGKNRPQALVPMPMFSPGVPAVQALQRSADLATRAQNNLQSELAELERARNENFIQTRWIIIAGAILIAIALVIIGVLALRL